MHAPKWVRDILCEDDANTVYCPARVGWALGDVAVLAGFIYTLWQLGTHIAMADLKTFAETFSITNAAGSAAFFAKQRGDK